MLCAVYVEMEGTTSVLQRVFFFQAEKKMIGKENKTAMCQAVQIIKILLKKAAFEDASGVAFWVLNDCGMTVCLLNVRLKRSSCSLIVKDRHTLIFWIVAMKRHCNGLKYNSV